MSDSNVAIAKHIYDEWHLGFNTQDMDRVAVLYAEDAVLETPAVLSNYPDMEEGILRGRDKIKELFELNLKRLSGTFVDLYRTEFFFSDGQYLTWEYPRLTPSGSQVDLFESMDIRDGLIVYHRVYWGWRGMKALMENRAKLI